MYLRGAAARAARAARRVAPPEPPRLGRERLARRSYVRRGSFVLESLLREAVLHPSQVRRAIWRSALTDLTDRRDLLVVGYFLVVKTPDPYVTRHL